ncbi:MAG TPA: metallophosphoesterase, partial [Verrucomicrobiae bacterium]|nr:metallophosphoesterase [Verrucomicrobiae bacterium]
MDADIVTMLEQRLGRLHARQRLGIEREFEGKVFSRGRRFFHIENLYSASTLIRTVLKATGLYARGRRNADRVRLRENPLSFADLPPAFDGFRILHLSDLHVEMSAPAMERAAALAASISYDIAVLTGDYRAATYGAYDTTLEGLARLRPHLKGPVYGVLGNHDSIRMVPGMEAMGIRMLLNESETIRRDDQAIHLAGIDDAGFYGVDNIQKAGEEIPHGGFAILLSHTPEVYR